MLPYFSGALCRLTCKAVGKATRSHCSHHSWWWSTPPYHSPRSVSLLPRKQSSVASRALQKEKPSGWNHPEFLEGFGWHAKKHLQPQHQVLLVQKCLCLLGIPGRNHESYFKVTAETSLGGKTSLAQLNGYPSPQNTEACVTLSQSWLQTNLLLRCASQQRIHFSRTVQQLQRPESSRETALWLSRGVPCLQGQEWSTGWNPYYHLLCLLARRCPPRHPSSAPGAGASDFGKRVSAPSPPCPVTKTLYSCQCSQKNRNIFIPSGQPGL